MLTEGRHNTHARQFGEEMCQRIVAAGFPIWRGFCFVATLHPEVAATAYVWNRDETGARRSLAGHELVNLPEFTQSPIASVRKNRTVMRRRLSDPLCPLDFPILDQFKAEGASDYIAIPMIRSDGEVNVITFLTDFAGGFTDGEATGLEDIAHALGLITELQSARRIARTLLDTYIGRRTGKRVLSGAIQRGSGETIRAVIWDNDLRGFTAMADSLPREALTILLNHYFEIMAGAVTAEGGEVLKFIGRNAGHLRDHRR
jgi:adenylate cyclase